MRSCRTNYVCILLLGCLGSTVGFDVRAEEPQTSSLSRSVEQFHADIVPILDQHCVHCHTADSPAGNVTLDEIDSPEQLYAHIRTWLKVARTQRDQFMPPQDEDQPTDAQRQALITWAETLGQQLDQKPQTDPGAIVFRRLNRLQYNNTLRDLLGVDYDVATAVGLPEDPVAFGFNNIGTALEVPPLLLEKYLAAADEMLARAVDTKPASTTFDIAEVPYKLEGELPEGKGKDGPIPPATELVDGYRLFRLNSTHHFPLKIEKEGTYRLELAAWGHKGPKWAKWQPDLAIGVNGQNRKSISVLGTRENPGVEVITLRLPAGEIDLSIEFLNAEVGPAWSENDHRFKHMGWKSLTVTGPVSPQGIIPSKEAHDKIFIAEPSSKLPARDAAHQIVKSFATRAFRRPVEADEVDRLLVLFDMAQAEGANFEESVRYSMKAVLVSPSFLFRIEPAAEGDQPQPIDDYALASRLSYFLWNTMPDEELFRLAESQQLHQPEVLRKQVARLLADEHSKVFVHDFAEQWLQLDELEHALPSEEFFPEFTARTRHAMRTEVLLFMEHLVQENQSAIDLLDADYSFTNRDLTSIYRYGGYQQEFQKAEINKRRNPERGGLLGMGGILTMTSHVSRNSPTRRGKWVLDVIIGDPPAPPPANVEQIDEGSDKNQAKSFRELLSLHADESSTCAGCHRKMDPLGFALDQFNPIGRFEREREGEPVNSTGILPGGRQVDGVVELKAILLEQKPRFVRNLTEHLMTYALGRELTFEDRPAVAQIVERAAANDFKMQELIYGIIESYPFQYRRGFQQQVASAP
ncbi:DUF1592 domain-containing protein [Bremerella sp. JC817]|uniref:DUF1592 domain-containing protein n=1 Tax=Bremerella sp. JC817 TaxID=3231756 RepID=UPI00345B4643